MMLPTFMILGAAKAGTTSLSFYLSQHPDVFMSSPKEPLFFHGEYQRGMDYYLNTYFRAWRGQNQVGEAAHRNLFLPYVPRRIAETLPHARLIVMVRNPVERAWSHYCYDRSRGQAVSFEGALERDLERLRNGPFFTHQREYVKALDKHHFTPDYPTFLDSGYYAEQIERYLGLFGRERVKIIYFEDFVRNTAGIVTETLQFLGLPIVPIRDLSPQNRPIPKFVGSFYRAVGAFPGVSRLPSKWREDMKRAIGGRFARSNQPMNAETRSWLSDHYAPYNKALEMLTQRDLAHWR